MKKRKRIGVIIVSSFMLITTTLTCVAAEEYAKKVYVDSNRWTSITKVTKQYSDVNPEVKITDILTASGSDSDYKKVKIKIDCNGSEICSKTIQKGSYTTMEVNYEYKKTGYTYYFSAMGNNPKLDCIISGYFNAH